MLLQLTGTAGVVAVNGSDDSVAAGICSSLLCSSDMHVGCFSWAIDHVCETMMHSVAKSWQAHLITSHLSNIFARQHRGKQKHKCTILHSCINLQKHAGLRRQFVQFC